MTGVAAPAVWSPARAQGQDTLLVVTESGPNILDIQGVGTNRPGYEVSFFTGVLKVYLFYYRLGPAAARMTQRPCAPWTASPSM